MSEGSSAALGKKEKAPARLLEKTILCLSCILDLCADFLSAFDSGIHRRAVQSPYNYLCLFYHAASCLAF